MDNQETNATRISRPFYFGFIGLVGCLIGAILGELFLTLTKGKVVERPPRNEMDIVLLIDTSGSMRGNPLAEVQRAMQAVIPMVKPLDKLAIVAFDSDARIVQGLTNDGDQLRNCIDGLQAYGATFMSAGLEISRQILEETDWDKRQPCVLLFSDGAPTESTNHCVSLARTMRRKGIAMIAIGAYGANIRFLERLVGANNVINAVNGNILDAFRQAVQTLQGSHGFMEGNAGFDVSLGRRIFRAFGWSVLLSIGTILLLLMFQNRLMGNSMLEPEQLAEQLGASIGGGLCCGFLSGVVTQFIFEVTTDNIDMIAYTIKSLCLLIAIVLGIVLFFQLKSNNRKASNSSGIGCLTFILMLVLMFFFREGGVFVTNGMFIFSVLSWAIWGWGITNIIGVIIPNFDRRRALWAGALGGAVASLGFLASSAIAGEISGRLIGSCFLGFAIGTLVGFLRGSKEGKQVTVYDTVTHEYVTTSNVGTDAVKLAGKMNGGLKIVLDGDVVSIKDVSGNVKTLNTNDRQVNVGRFVVTSELVIDEDALEHDDHNSNSSESSKQSSRPDESSKEKPSHTEEASSRNGNDNTQKEQKPSRPSVQAAKSVAFAKDDKLCLLWLGNDKSRYEKTVSFLQAVSNGGSSSSDNVIVLPNALKGKITGAAVEQYLADKNNQGLLMTFTVKKSLFSRERIHFLDYESSESGEKDTKAVIIMDYDTLIHFKSSKEMLASLHGLIGHIEKEHQSSCLVIVLKEQPLLESPFFNSQAQEQVKARYPGVGRGEMTRILLNEMLEKFGVTTEFDRLGKKVSYKLTSLNELEAQLKNYASPRN